jgi:signal transduction protein with GAF and PtsI domain
MDNVCAINNSDLFNIISDEEKQNAIDQIKQIKKSIKQMSVDQLKQNANKMAELIPYANLQLKTALDLNKLTAQEALKAEDEVNELKMFIEELKSQLEYFKERCPLQDNPESQRIFDNMFQSFNSNKSNLVPNNLDEDKINQRLMENLKKLKELKKNK